MALQPSDRPSGSSQVLRFIGTVVAGTALATFPKANGEFTTGGAVGDVRGVRFLLADATDLTNMQRQLPSGVYDDGAPAGAAPHNPIATGLTALVVNAGEQAIGVGGANTLMRTWTQNTWVIAKGLSANIGSMDTEGAYIVLDTLTSGLGLNSGLPVLILPVTLLGGAVASFDVDILVEVRQSMTR
jgi:hypothetical protein